MKPAKPRPVSIWFCSYHGERINGRSHRFRFTDEDGCCVSWRCDRGVQYFPDVPAPSRRKRRKK